MARVHHLNCGTMCPYGARLLAGVGGLFEKTDLACHCLLIEAGDGLILIDTGLGTGDCADPDRLGQPFRAIVRPVLSGGETAIARLRDLGVDPGDVRHIVMTHLNLDHAGGLGDFPAAKVHLFAPELEASRNPPLRERTRYIPAQVAHGPDWWRTRPTATRGSASRASG